MEVAPRRGEIVIAWCLALLATYILFAATRMPAGMNGQPGSGFVPTGIGSVLLVAALGLIVRAHRLGAAAQDALLVFGQARIWVTLVALVAVAFLLEPLGYLLTSALLLFVLLRAYGQTSWTATVLGAIAGAALSWAFFHNLLGVSLPAGVLGIR